MPASTSSNTRVVGRAAVSTSRSASIDRASSPPEATFVSGSGGAPGLAARRNAHVVARVVADRDLDAGLGHRQLPQVGLGGRGQRRRGRPPGRAHHLLGGRRPRRRRRARSRVELGGQAIVVLQLDAAGATASSRNSMTSARVSPYLRCRSCRSRRRSRIVGLPLRVLLDRLTGGPHLGGHVGQLGGRAAQARHQLLERSPSVEGGDGLRQRARSAPSSTSRAREASAAASWWACASASRSSSASSDSSSSGSSSAGRDRARRPGSAAGRSPGPAPARRRRARPGARRSRTAILARLERAEVDPGEAVERLALHRRRPAATGDRAGRGGRPGGPPARQRRRPWPGARRRRPASARPGHDPTQDDLVAVEHEAALDDGLGGAVADHPGIGPAAHQQLDGLDDQRLARAGLAGDRGHPGLQHQRQLADDPEVADGQLVQHQSAPISPLIGRLGHRSLRPNFALRMRWKSRGPNTTSRARCARRGALDGVARTELVEHPAVDRQRGRPVAAHGEPQHGVGLEHQRPVEQHVGRHRGQHHGAVGRRDDRPAGREGVGRRPGGVATIRPSAA